MQEGGAVCASHPSRRSVRTCPRCGRFCCEACAEAAPCLECQVVQRQASRPLSPRFDQLIAMTAVLYAVCTILMVPALAQLDFTKPNVLTGTPGLVFRALETVSSGVALTRMLTYLLWYLALIDWAKGRGVTTPRKVVAIACWFMPFLNLVHPLATIRKIRTSVAVRTPVGWWWTFLVVSIITSVVEAGLMLKGRHDPILNITLVIEVGCLYLGWRIVRDFRRADQRWNPGQALAARNAQNVSTSVAPS